MQENQIIIFHPDDETYNVLMRRAVEYAILSVPFTVNRMSIDNPAQRIENIAKGKLAEYLFLEYCEKNGINIDTKECTTPFYQVDKRDFLFSNFECDIKNNYFWNNKPHSSVEELIIKFPALIPNRHKDDQWDKRTKSYFNRKVMFVFTFMQAGYLVGRNRQGGVVEVILSKEQGECLKRLIKHYNGCPIEKEPYTPDSFWGEFGQLKFTIRNVSPLYITAYATQEYFNIFHDIGGEDVSTNYQNDPFPNWYDRKGTGAKFLGGSIFTKIKNAACPIRSLPSFRELLDKLGYPRDEAF